MTGALDVGRGVSALWVRAAAGLACAGILADLALHGAAGFILGIVAILGLACVYVPASPAPLLVIGIAAMVLTVSGDDPLRPGVLVMVPLVHLLHLSCAIAAVLPKGARIAPAALRPPVRRAAATELVVFAIAAVAVFVPTGRTPVIVELIALLSIAGIALVVIILDRYR
ncbi:hypothetical protein [Actinokineospora sp.]|uniref:hypothetical protein n=1 Tax=Actinokineospora sp. TaxID=1872133 RepID=UPI0040378063